MRSPAQEVLRTMSEARPTACVICSINCGLSVKTEGRRLVSIRGDRAHPTSRGYLCEKSGALDHYQNGADRLSSPLRRRPDGSYEEVDWDTAIREVAARLAAVRDDHGGERIFYYGGGAQANHMGGAYARALRAALGSVYTSNALAQEKTGEFWVDGQLYGRARCHTTPDFEHAQVGLFVGKNPWHSHGFPRARVVLRQMSKDPTRTLIVIDPRRTETAELADIHLQVRPAGDAWLLAAMVKLLLDEGCDLPWLEEHANGLEELRLLLANVDVSRYCARAGVEEALVRRAVSAMAGAESLSVLEDLGIQQAPHSTLSSWLEKLLYLLTGNLGKQGGMNIHTSFAGLGGGKGARRGGSPVGGHRIIGGLMPCNTIADECLADHPDRFRAMIIESTNPVISLADSPRFAQAMRHLDFTVVIDVAFTETAAQADYVLPASSQFEKWEAAFFNLEFPENAVHLRQPVLAPLNGTLPEVEIHTRLVRALGALDDLDLSPLHAAAEQGMAPFAMAFAMAAGGNRQLMKLAPVVLYETMGPLLPGDSRQAAVMWALCQQVAMRYPEQLQRAGVHAEDGLLGNALFQRLLESPSGMVFTVDDHDATLARLETPDGRVRLVVDELVDELHSLHNCEPVSRNDAFPFVLAAGERRSNTANALFRDPDWHGDESTLRMNPDDASRLGLLDGSSARVVTRRGSALVQVEHTDTLLPGHVSLPNGQGVRYPDAAGVLRRWGISLNELTSSDDRDPIAGTPWHKHVRARVEAVPVSG